MTRIRYFYPIFWILIIICLYSASSLAAAKNPSISGELENWAVYYDAVDAIYKYSVATRSDEKIIDKLPDSRLEDIVLNKDIMIRSIMKGSVFDDRDYEVFINRSHENTIKDSQSLFNMHKISRIAISNDGKQIAISGLVERPEAKDPVPDGTFGKLEYPNEKLYLYHVGGDGKLEKHVDSNVAWLSSLQAWSPDSNKLLFESTDGDLMLLDVFEGKINVLVRNAGDASWAPDGGKILYLDNPREEKPGDYYLLDLATGEKRLLLKNKPLKINFLGIGREYFRTPGVWSPSGDYIFLSIHVESLFSAPYEIAYLLDVSTGKLERLGRTQQAFVDADTLPLEWHNRVQ